MSRPLRLEFEGAIYHVTSRGNDREAVFVDDEDDRRFLEVLGLVVADCGFVVHAFCLMTNHFHILLETTRANLSSGMQRINGRYTQLYNLRHGRVGHLFQGRYKAILVERDAYLLELCRYVVLNPVRAGMVSSPGQWRWSSYRATAGKVAAPEWLDTEWTLSQFRSRRGSAQESYRRFVAEGEGLTSPLSQVKSQIYLGGDAFRGSMEVQLKGSRWDGDIPHVQRMTAPIGVDRIKRVVAKSFGTKLSSLSRRRGSEDKMAAIYLARRLSGLKGYEIAEEFGVKPARVSNIDREVESGSRKSLLRRIKEIEAELRTDSSV